MALPQQTAIRNGLLSRISAKDFHLIQPHLEEFALEEKLTIVAENEAAEFLYFPTSGIISSVVTSPSGQMVEAGLFGRESCAPIVVASGSASSFQEHMVQVPGEGFRAPVKVIWEMMALSPEFSSVLVKALQAFATQVSFTALSNAVHEVPDRLARWLLMCHDRIDGDEIVLTHAFMSVMLGTRRPTVTTSFMFSKGTTSFAPSVAL